MQETDFQGQSEKTQDPKSFNNIHNLFELQKKRFLILCENPPQKSILIKKNRIAYKGKQIYYHSCYASGHDKISNNL